MNLDYLLRMRRQHNHILRELKNALISPLLSALKTLLRQSSCIWGCWDLTGKCELSSFDHEILSLMLFFIRIRTQTRLFKKWTSWSRTLRPNLENTSLRFSFEFETTVEVSTLFMKFEAWYQLRPAVYLPQYISLWLMRYLHQSFLRINLTWYWVLNHLNSSKVSLSLFWKCWTFYPEGQLKLNAART